MEYKERTYRNKVSNKCLLSFHVHVSETDLFICSDTDLSERAYQSVYYYRRFIESYIKYRPEFLTSLKPIDDDHLAPPIIRDMLSTSHRADVGPMASVAGAVAEYVGKDLLKLANNVIVENGGDIFLKTETEVTVGVFAGESPLNYTVNILLKPDNMPLGICTSSGTVGHSLSFGKADAVCVVSQSSTMADAAATAIGNMVKNKHDIRLALEKGIRITGVLGVLIIIGDHFGAVGEIELV